MAEASAHGDLATPEKVKQGWASWYAANRESNIQKCIEYNKINADKLRVRRLQLYAENREKYRGMRASGSAATGLGCGNMRSDTGGQILSAFRSFALVVAPLKQALMALPLAI